MKLCLIYNFAQHYRTDIFTLIDKEFSCDFVFGDSMSDVKKMDYGLLRGKVTETHTKYLFGNWYWQPSVVNQLFKDYDHYILWGETRALSTWLFCVLARIFKPKKKVYFWSHGWYGKETKLESLVKKLEFKLPNGGIFTYGDYARKLMIQEGFNPNKIYPIHNSLAYDQQIEIRQSLKSSRVYPEHFENENPNLFFVGRLTPVKQLDQILDAMRKGCIPVISDSKHGSLDIIKKCETGVIVKQGDSTLLFNAIKDIIINHDKYIESYKKTYDFSLKFLSQEKWGKIMREVIKSAMNTPKITKTINRRNFLISLENSYSN